MAAERKNGAGLQVAGVLERMTPPPKPAAARDPEDAPPESADQDQSAGPKGRGAPARKSRASAPAGRKIKGHTIYIPDDLFERILVGAHRRDRTISEYVVAILDRQVPDHRTMRLADPGDSTDAA